MMPETGSKHRTKGAIALVRVVKIVMLSVCSIIY